MLKILKQPLIHFLLLGLAVFLAFNYSATRSRYEQDDRTIVIDREALLTFMQYRSRAFNEQHFSRQLDSMDRVERRRLIDDLVREEVLYREAMSLQLDENDYVIKRRLIQKLEFLTRGFINVGSSLTDAEIYAYFQEHKQDYYVQPSVTFTHVFIDYELHDTDQAMKLAAKTLEELNLKRVSFADGIQYGDRFLYHTNYVDRARDYVASHFGVEMTEAVFALDPDQNNWQGPYESPYGLHLVMLTGSEPGRFPEVNEIYNRVKDEAEQAVIREKTEEAINEIINRYDVKVVLD